MFRGCATSNGAEALVPTSETTDARKYIEILEKHPNPQVSRHLGGHAITIQHDTTPCHVSSLIRKNMLAYSAIKSKRTLGLSNNFTMEELSQELNKASVFKFPRKK